MAKAREDINIAFNEWKAVESSGPLEHKDYPAPPHATSTIAVPSSTTGTSSMKTSSKRRKVNVETGSTASVSSTASSSSSTPNVRLAVKRDESEDT